jgi:hypothetical protein
MTGQLQRAQLILVDLHGAVGYFGLRQQFGLRRVLGINGQLSAQSRGFEWADCYTAVSAAQVVGWGTCTMKPLVFLV